MKIAIAQIDTKAGDHAHTLTRMVAQSHAAEARGVDLVIFPPTVLTGNLALPFGLQEPYMAHVSQVLDQFAAEVSCACIVPLVAQRDEFPTIEVMLVSEGTVTALGKKDTSAKRGEPPIGWIPPTLERAGSRLVFARSYEELDLLVNAKPAQGTDVIIFLNAYGYAVDDPSSAMGAALMANRFVEDAKACGTWLVGVAPVGGYGSQAFGGASFALCPDGRVAALAAAFEEDLLVADVGHGVTVPMGQDLTPPLYDERTFLWEVLAAGLRGYVEKTGASGVVLGIDGTLSSVALAALATDALGPLRVHAIDCVPLGHPRRMVPTLLARTLRIDVRDASGALATYASGDAALARDLAAVQVAALARELGALALGSSDKTALALGELAGMPQGMLAPLGDVYRIDVLDIARTRNTVTPVFGSIDLVEEDVPTLGVSWGTFDLDVRLEHIDDALAMHIEGGRAPREVAKLTGSEERAAAVLGSLLTSLGNVTSLPDVIGASTCPLSVYRVPHSFAWEGMLEHAAEGDETEKPSWWEDPQAPQEVLGAPLGVDALDDERAQALHEALDLLRDWSTGIGTDWHNPFSEN